MPHISTGGVSNQIVDPDFIAEPGTPVEKALDEGLPNVNGTEDAEQPDTEPEQGSPKEPAKDGTDDGSEDDDRRVGNELPAYDTPKKSTPAKKTNPASKK
jgi:hypothetical protein